MNTDWNGRKNLKNLSQIEQEILHTFKPSDEPMLDCPIFIHPHHQETDYPQLFTKHVDGLMFKREFVKANGDNEYPVELIRHLLYLQYGRRY